MIPRTQVQGTQGFLNLSISYKTKSIKQTKQANNLILGLDVSWYKTNF